MLFDKVKFIFLVLGFFILFGGVLSLEFNFEKVEGVLEGVEGRDRMEEIVKVVGKVMG